jgi:hypothetical protein
MRVYLFKVCGWHLIFFLFSSNFISTQKTLSNENDQTIFGNILIGKNELLVAVAAFGQGACTLKLYMIVTDSALP